MKQDYVLLVSTPRVAKLKPGPDGIAPIGGVGELNPDDAEVKRALGLFQPIAVPPPGAENGYINGVRAESDGGNGSGGDGGAPGRPLSARFGYQSLSYWNFRACPPAGAPAGGPERFPLVKRYEACLYFDSFAESYAFLTGKIDGIDRKTILQNVFVYVQLVAVSKQA